MAPKKRRTQVSRIIEDTGDKIKRDIAPGVTPEAVERRMIGIATALAERQIIAGTASAQVITHFLKLGSSIAKLEQEKLARENEFTLAKTEALKSQKKVEELMVNALTAIRSYSGHQGGVINEEDIPDP